MRESKIIEGFGALAQPTRMAMFRALRAVGDAGMAAGDLADLLDVPPPTLSFHLKEMTAAGILVSKRDGRRVIYAVDTSAVELLIGFLTSSAEAPQSGNGHDAGEDALRVRMQEGTA